MKILFEKIDHVIQKFSVKHILFLLLIVILSQAIFNTIDKIYQKSDIEKQIAKEIMYYTQSLNWTEMTDAESKYYKTMIAIFTHYSHQYDPKYKKAMTDEQKVLYMRHNFRFAELLGDSPFTVPCIAHLETSFDPYANHFFGELGIHGIKWSTACEAEKYLKYMPDNIRRELEFDLKCKEDLLDPIISLKVTYTLLWAYRREFAGREDWYIGIYHWGRFLNMYWDYKKNTGEMPIRFTITGQYGTKVYNVLKYYTSFAMLKEAYENGMIEPCKPIVEKWQDYYAKMVQEELDYRRCKTAIKRLMKTIKNYEKAMDEKDKAIMEMKKELIQARKVLKQIAGETKKGGGKKKLGEKVKALAKDLLKKLKVIK